MGASGQGGSFSDAILEEKRGRREEGTARQDYL